MKAVLTTLKFKPMPQKKARIKDIAKLAGISIGTVNRVLHDRGEVAEKTKIKILQIIKETHYSPNLGVGSRNGS